MNNFSVYTILQKIIFSRDFTKGMVFKLVPGPLVFIKN